MKKLPERLATSDLVLRRLQLDDLDELTAAVHEALPTLTPWMPWAHPDYSRDDAADFLARVWLGWGTGDTHEFAVCSQKTSEILGLCGLNMRSGSEMNLGYWIRPSQAGSGVTTRATRAVARFGFEHVGLSRVSLFHMVGNTGSRRVAEKVGFRYEGLRRAHYEVCGVRHDTRLYALTSAEEVTS